jgi:hypothetical protein
MNASAGDAQVVEAGAFALWRISAKSDAHRDACADWQEGNKTSHAVMNLLAAGASFVR